MVFSVQLGKSAKVLLAALATLAFTASSVSARVINFIELDNEAGIRFTSDNGADVTKLGSEVFHLSSLAIPAGYPADATESRIGISQSADYFLVNILESVGGPLSDQVFVHRLNGNFTVIDFISDPAQFVVGIAATSTVIETGALQNVLNYLNDRGEAVSINIKSAVELPEPATVLLIPLALAGMRLNKRRLTRQAAAV